MVRRVALLPGPQQAIPLCALVVLSSLGSWRAQAQERYLFWIGSGDSTEIQSSTIFRYTVDGGDIDTLIRAVDLGAVDSSRWFSHVTVDTIRNRIYWTDTGGTEPDETDLIGAIRRATVDGVDPEVMLGTIVCGLGTAMDIQLDPVYEVVYWGEFSDCMPNALYKWDFAWPFWETLPISEGFVVDAIDIDFLNEIMYWVTIDFFDEPPPGIVRAPLDVTASHEYIVSGCVGDIALAHALSRIYWASCDSSQIRRANLDGTGAEDVFVGEGEVSHLAIDHKEGKIYWTETETGKLSRANLDGSETEDLLTGLIGPTSLALSFGWDSHLSSATPGAVTPEGVDLRGIYPNPVRGLATVAFALSEPSDVTLEIYDALGRQIEVAASGTYPPGTFEVPWNATGHAAGVYFCRMTSGGRVETIAFIVQ